MSIRCPGSVVKSLLGFLLFAASLPALAQPVWCDGDESLPNHPFHFDTLRSEVVSAGLASDIPGMIDLVAQKFAARQLELDPVPGSNEANSAASFEQLLESNDGAVDFRFTVQRRQQRAILTRSESPTIVLSCDQPLAEMQSTASTLVDIGLAAYAIDRLGRDILAGALEVAVIGIDSLSTSYRNWLLDDGLAQWPWEMAVNGWLTRKDPFNAPAPRHQWVFMRPSAGLEFSWASQAEASVDASVGIEPLGMVWYLGDASSYKRWIGVSALVTLGTSDEGAGVGGLIRYNNLWLGVTGRSGQDSLYVFVGFDLHKYIKGNDGLTQDLQNWIAGQ